MEEQQVAVTKSRQLFFLTHKSNCKIIAGHVVSTLNVENQPDCFPKGLHHFAFPPRTPESFRFSAVGSALGTVSVVFVLKPF